MAKQTFTTGQVLSAAQLTSLQQTAMGGGSATAKTVSYVLVAADAGTTVAMNAAGATTITVNTGLFAAGDTVFIQNLGAGACTVTAGTATVATAGSLILPQNDAGILYFTATGASIFYDFIQPTGGGKVLQVVTANATAAVSSSSTTYVTTGLTASITPTLNTSKVLVLVTQNGCFKNNGNSNNALNIRLRRSSTTLAANTFVGYTATASENGVGTVAFSYLDSPATTSATTYSTEFSNFSATSFVAVQQNTGDTSSIVLLEIGA